MAKEKYTVFYNVTEAGNQKPANWKEKTIKVKATGKEKNAGLVNSDEEPNKQFNASEPFLQNTPLKCEFVTIEAESEEEAAEALTAFYGPQALVQGKVLGAKSSAVKEVNAQK